VIASSLEKHFKVSYDPKRQILIAVGVSEAMDIALSRDHQSRRRGNLS
jgi:aspartate/methionine/tyrosine aminotransferase